MKEGTGCGATRALFAALDVDWPSVGGVLAKLRKKHGIPAKFQKENQLKISKRKQLTPSQG